MKKTKEIEQKWDEKDINNSFSSDEIFRYLLDHCYSLENKLNNINECKC